MKLLHMSDSHIGLAAYAKLTPDGLNQREQDMFDAFRRALDLAIRERVDVVLHSGDLFDSVRPTNRALSFVMGELRRLHDASIPFVVISGNHEAPRLRETGAVLRLLEFVPGVSAVYKGATEVVRIQDLAIHATPHAPSNDALLSQVRAAKPDASARWNVAALHVGLLGVGDFRTGEFNEQVVPQNELPQGMDYVALGHYHKRTEVAPGVWFAGSTERCTFREASEEKSVNLVDLAKGRVTPLALPARPMFDLPTLDLRGVADAAASSLIYERLAERSVEGAIARLRVSGLAPHVYATLDFARVKALTSAALHFELQAEIVRDADAGRAAASSAWGALPDEFDAFLRDRTVGTADREALAGEARALLREAGAA